MLGKRMVSRIKRPIPETSGTETVSLQYLDLAPEEHLFTSSLMEYTWGLYNLTERPDEAFSGSYFKGKDDDWFSFNHNGTSGR